MVLGEVEQEREGAIHDKINVETIQSWGGGGELTACLGGGGNLKQ